MTSERSEFEKWAVTILGDNPNWRESGYCELAWQSWQARAALATQPAEVDAFTNALEVMEGFTGEDWSEMFERLPALAEQFEGYAARKVADASGACHLPPEGWECSRTPGHEGPCAAYPATQPAAGDPVSTRLKLPTPEQVMHVVMKFQWEDRKNGTGTTNWAANLGMTVVEYIARLNPTPPAAAPVAAGEPVALLREVDAYLYGHGDNAICNGSRLHREIKDLLAALPAAAHGDEAGRKRIQQLEVLLDRCRDHVSESMELMDDYDDAEEDAGIAQELLDDIDAVMRAQGDGESS